MVRDTVCSANLCRECLFKVLKLVRATLIHSKSNRIQLKDLLYSQGEPGSQGPAGLRGRDGEDVSRSFVLTIPNLR